MNKITDQIAAEALEKILAGSRYKTFPASGIERQVITTIIKAAIEKAVAPFKDHINVLAEKLDKSAIRATQANEPSEWDEKYVDELIAICAKIQGAAHASEKESPEAAYHRGYDAGWEAHKERAAHAIDKALQDSNAYLAGRSVGISIGIKRTSEN